MKIENSYKLWKKNAAKESGKKNIVHDDGIEKKSCT
jgi:hypothetical protein